MLESERKKLFDPKIEYVNIGISEGGVAYGMIPVMWDSTAAAYNMKSPNVFISPEDLCDGEVMARIRSLNVRGLYIYTPLDDYGFIADFSDLYDIHIECAENMKNLDFLSEMHDCAMLFLHNANLSDIDVLWEVKKANKGIVRAFRYVGLYDCNVDKTPDFSDCRCYFTEFLVWSKPENAERDREKWSSLNALTKKYYLIQPKKK